MGARPGIRMDDLALECGVKNRRHATREFDPALECQINLNIELNIPVTAVLRLLLHKFNRLGRKYELNIASKNTHL